MNKLNLFWIVSSLFLASLEPVIVKFAYSASASPWTLFFVKSVTGMCLGVFGLKHIRHLSKRNVLTIAFLGGLLSLTSLLTLVALTRVSAILAVTFVSITPAIVAIVNSRLGRDHLTPKFWFGFLCCFGGVILSLNFTPNLKDSGFDALGLACLTGALLSSTLYRAVLEKVTRQVASTTVSSLMFLTNGLLSALLFGPWLIPKVGTADLQFGVVIGMAAILANVAFVNCIALLGSTRSSIINMLQRPIVVIFAAILLDETMIVSQWLGVILVFLGIHLARDLKRRSQPIVSPSLRTPST